MHKAYIRNIQLNVPALKSELKIFFGHYSTIQITVSGSLAPSDISGAPEIRTIIIEIGKKY